jgi:hypothetical protein
MAPKSRTNYRYFRLGPVLCADGTVIDCGKITLGAGHANEQWGVVPSREHYDNSALCAAVVNVGEDQYGIWVAGALTAGMTEEKIAELRRSPLSGDWRRVDGNLEMIAALAVNNPGFVVREKDGATFSMMGVGVVEDDHEFTIDTMPGVTDFDARLAAIQERRNSLKVKQNADRLKEIDKKKQNVADAQQASLIARQMNTKFSIIKE